jgi:hypothetical protein
MSAHDQRPLAHARMPACREDVEFVIAHDSLLPVDILLLSSSHTAMLLILFAHDFPFPAVAAFSQGMQLLCSSFLHLGYESTPCSMLLYSRDYSTVYS